MSKARAVEQDAKFEEAGKKMASLQTRLENTARQVCHAVLCCVMLCMILHAMYITSDALLKHVLK